MVRPLFALGSAAAITLLGAFALGAASHGSTARRDALAGHPTPVRPAPEWRNTRWLNTPGDRALTLGGVRGHVVLLNFWTFTCWNCTNTVPSLVDLDRKYRAQGFTVIGIHRPEFPPYAGEHDPDNVRAALAKYHIEYPNALDNDHATWDLYDIMYWPSFVLIDKRGNIRYEGAGEFHLNDATYARWDGRIRELLAEQ